MYLDGFTTGRTMDVYVLAVTCESLTHHASKVICPHNEDCRIKLRPQCSRTMQYSPEVIKVFSCSTQLSMEF